MMGVLGALGGFAWPLIKWAFPGIPASVTSVLGVVLLGLVAVGGPAASVWLYKNGQISGVREAEQFACEARIAESARTSAQELAELLTRIREAEADAEEPKTKAEELALCRGSKLCRENGK